MRVGFHAGQLLQPVPGGIGRYQRALLAHLPDAGVDVVAFAAGARPKGVDPRVPWIDLGPPHGSVRYEAWHRVVGQAHFVACGSVGCGTEGDARARYAVVYLGEPDIAVGFRSVDYDHVAVVRDLAATGCSVDLLRQPPSRHPPSGPHRADASRRARSLQPAAQIRTKLMPRGGFFMSEY